MDLFVEGQKLTLFFQKNSNIVEMTCFIEKIFNDRLNLSLPQYFMRYIEFLQVGKELTAKAFSKTGTIDFNSIVISSPLEDVFTIELDYNSLKLTEGKDIPPIEAIENLEIVLSNDNIIKLKTFEISPSTIKFTSNDEWKLNSHVECKLFLPKDYGIIEFKAEVIERDAIYENEYTAKFLTISEEDRQSLLYYIYVYSKDI